MTVTPHERARFLCESHGNTYLVDLMAYRGTGACSCLHFLSRLKPEIEAARKRGDFKPGDAYRCPHIKQARNVMLDMFLEQMAKQFPDNSMETT